MTDTTPRDPSSGNVLMGAQAIADFLECTTARVYYLVAYQRIPIYRMGSVLCARKTTLLDWIKNQENKNGNGGHSARN